MASRATTAPAVRRSASASDSDPDIKIGDFVRGKEIGKGSFASVYIASHKTKRSFAAVKAVEQKKLTRKLKENLESEIRILKSLQHPHIVALFSCIETNAHIYLIMEYCQLSDLAQFMKKREQLATLPETRDIFRKYPNTPGFGLNEVLARHFLKQITSALEYLRLRNLIHRDIKPQNLLLNPSPAFMSRQRPEDVPLAASEHSLIPAVGVQTLPMLKIADFGFARHLPARSLAETLCGSPLYMAPEILSYKKYDAKADLWSVGTVTYEMLIGKPPFKAANHVDLLRKIDQAEDKIPYPKGFALSVDLQELIESLLKRDPEHRVEFEEFFQSPPITDPIPGLVGEDIIIDPDDGRSTSDLRRLRQIQTTERPSSKAIINQESAARSPSTNARRRSSIDEHNQRSNADPISEMQRRPSSGGRPAIQAHATAPAREYVTLDQQAARAAPMQRQSSATGYTGSTKQVTPSERTRPRSRSDRDMAAQDMAFEKEYVMIEKRAVEVNAFADELAAARQVSSRQTGSGGAGTMVRRATTTTAPSSTSSNAMQLTSGRRVDVPASRQPSYERRYAPSPSSATNMLSKALNMANARLYGMLGASPPVGTGISPPRGYGAYPAYPPSAVGLAITDGKEQVVPLDEDSKVLRTIEEAATRSDTVYSFAEVKYRQLLPATPSSEDISGPRPIGINDAALDSSDASAAYDLTQTAVITVSEEALVLFVKALAILAKSIHLAGSWWAAQKRPDNDYRPTNPDVCKRMNNVVQWTRNRFNECLEKSEIVGRRLIESQRRLPHVRPGDQQVNDAGTGIDTMAEPIRFMSGVTAEKLMFERAVEMSRQAAINELIDEDLRGCEIAYRTAIMLLEAVLEGDDEPLLPRPSANKDKSADETILGIETEDRKTVVGLVDGARLRLKALCKKIQMQQAAIRRLSAESGGMQQYTRHSPSLVAATTGTTPS